MHQIHDDGLVPSQVGLPELSRDYCIWPVVGFWQLHIRLLLHAIQVFMEAVQQEINEFLGIVLVHPLEHGILLPYLPLDLEGRENAVGLVPEFIEQIGELEG